ncbi:MAG: hypothetical protein LUG18_14115 [Candidatus Azobacteroides sp.]|nr:hypothetical protein [Candidatus Azobacteroides sp.]
MKCWGQDINQLIRCVIRSPGGLYHLLRNTRFALLPEHLSYPGQELSVQPTVNVRPTNDKRTSKRRKTNAQRRLNDQVALSITRYRPIVSITLSGRLYNNAQLFISL